MTHDHEPAPRILDEPHVCEVCRERIEPIQCEECGGDGHDQGHPCAECGATGVEKWRLA